MAQPAPHYAGSIMADIARAVNADQTCEAAIDQRQANGAFGIYQARVTIPGDARPYRLLLAPADAPLGLINPGKLGDLERGYVIDDHFTEALA